MVKIPLLLQFQPSATYQPQSNPISRYIKHIDSAIFQSYLMSCQSSVPEKVSIFEHFLARNRSPQPSRINQHPIVYSGRSWWGGSESVLLFKIGPAVREIWTSLCSLLTTQQHFFDGLDSWFFFVMNSHSILIFLSAPYISSSIRLKWATELWKPMDNGWDRWLLKNSSK
jgi:hypothetical protein